MLPIWWTCENRSSNNASRRAICGSWSCCTAATTCTVSQAIYPGDKRHLARPPYQERKIALLGPLRIAKPQSTTHLVVYPSSPSCSACLKLQSKTSLWDSTCDKCGGIWRRSHKWLPLSKGITILRTSNGSSICSIAIYIYIYIIV